MPYGGSADVALMALYLGAALPLQAWTAVAGPLSVDALRSARLTHQLPMALDPAVIVYLQTPGMRHLYPSMGNHARTTLHREQH
jgi:hypothetical protein